MNQKRKMRYTSEKGITLIALVITIIVLLILAGVTISMVLGDDGIITQAQQAKKENEEATLKDEVSLSKGEAAVLKYGEQTKLPKDELGDIKAKIDEYNNGKTEDDVDYYKYENTITKITEDGVPIPLGFMHIQGTKKDTGLIVVDEYGNEFVWVPVDEVVEEEPKNRYEGTTVSLVHNESDTNDSPKVGEVPTAGAIATDYGRMKTSVDIYGGFFVGRYETSWTGSRVASVPNVPAMSGSRTVGNSGANWATFYTEQKKLHENSNSVVSGMIYGSQWDAIMDWMSHEENPYAVNPQTEKRYIFDSTGMGHYGYYGEDWIPITDEDEPIPIKTGSNSSYSVKNIFDLAGNYYEWTQEAKASIGRVIRGGDPDFNGFEYPASYRESAFPYDVDDYYFSSRLQLYIK